MMKEIASLSHAIVVTIAASYPFNDGNCCPDRIFKDEDYVTF